MSGIGKLEMVGLRVNFAVWLMERTGLRLSSQEGEAIFQQFLEGKLIVISIE